MAPSREHRGMRAGSLALAASAETIRFRKSPCFAEESGARRSPDWLSSTLLSFLEKSHGLVVAQRIDLEDEQFFDDLRDGRNARILEEARQREVDVEHLAQACNHARCRQRVSPGVEEALLVVQG